MDFGTSCLLGELVHSPAGELTRFSPPVLLWMERVREIQYRRVDKPAKHRPNPRTQEVRYRVYRISESLREAIREKRLKRGQTVQEFIRTAVVDELPRLVETVKALGIVPGGLEARPAKLPLDERLLAELRKASGEVGLSQSQLLMSCLRTSVTRKRRPSARKR
jgi:hypothetical protein